MIEVAGTTGFMAPEILKKIYDQQSEVWNLGIILNKLLTGDVYGV